MAALDLWYQQPAAEWTEALPIGNGRLGAMVHGGIGREELQLNESTLWSGGPYQPINPDALPNLAKVRELILAGKYAEAEAISNQNLMANPLSQMSYQPAGNVFIAFAHEAAPGTYQRALDLNTATVSTCYALLGTGIDPDAAVFERESFVSAVDDVVATRITASRPGMLSFEVWLDSAQPGAIVDGDAGGLTYRGHNFGMHGIEGRLSFGIDLQLQVEGGSVERRGRRLVVRGADAAVLLIDRHQFRALRRRVGRSGGPVGDAAAGAGRQEL